MAEPFAVESHHSSLCVFGAPGFHAPAAQDRLIKGGWQEPAAVGISLANHVDR